VRLLGLLGSLCLSSSGGTANVSNNIKKERGPMIYLIRHGEIVESNKKRYIGQTDVSLSAKGLRQAEYWQKELAQVRFEGVYCSDLTRALDTAKCVANAPESGIHVIPQLREISLGDWEGKPMVNIKTRFPDAWEERGRHMDSFQIPNGESFLDLHTRVIPVFEQIVSKRSGHVLMVAHAGVNRVILCHVLQKPIQDLFTIPQGYGALNLIDYQESKPIVLAINRTPAKE
jgi:alpha-ribazole phosphatase